MAIDIASGEFRLIQAKAVIIATGGAGRVFRENTNGGIVTGDGMALAYRHGVPLRDMEFVQYHPTGLPGTGLLITEACRGEGGFLVNKDGYRYLQDYGLGPAEPEPRNKAMELGPRDRLSQAFWHEEQKGRTIDGAARRGGAPRPAPPRREASCASACRRSASWPRSSSASIRRTRRSRCVPAVHYTMGGIHADGKTATPLPGLYSAGECSSVGIHGANRLGSNSLTELLVFGKVAGIEAASFAKSVPQQQCRRRSSARPRRRAQRALGIVNRTGRQRAHRRCCAARWRRAWKSGCGIYRTAADMQATCDKLAELKARYQNVQRRRPLEGLEHRVAARDRARLSARRGAGDGVFGAATARSRAARTSGSTASSSATTSTSSSTRWPTTPATAAPRIDYGAVKITQSPARHARLRRRRRESRARTQAQGASHV